MKRLIWLVVLFFWAVFAQPAFAQWYKGIIHMHSKFSDGAYNLDSIWEAAQKEGVQFIFMTDHDTCFGSDVDHSGIVSETNVRHWHESNNPYEAYVSRCRWLSEQGLPLMIPGLEVTATSTDLTRHLLVLGLDEDNWYLPYQPGRSEIEILQQLEERYSALGEKNYSFEVVLAHPSIWNPAFDLGGYAETLNSFTDYQYLLESGDLEEDEISAEVKGIYPLMAVEFFNHFRHPFSGEKTELETYLKFYQKGVESASTYSEINNFQIAVTCGNDSHGLLGTDTDVQYTFIEADELSKEALLKGLSLQRTYASVYGAEIQDLPYQIGVGKVGNQVEGSEVPFNFKLVWPRPFTAPKTVVLYCDGKEVSGSRKVFSAGPPPFQKREIEYSFVHQGLEEGIHEYFIYCEGQLITSPIYLYVKEGILSGSNSLIAFVRDGDIWLMNEDGTDQRQVTNLVNCRDPVFSSDGKNIGFVRGEEDRIVFYRIDLETEEIFRLISEDDYDEPYSWSPNLDQIAVARMVQIEDSQREVSIYRILLIKLDKNAILELSRIRSRGLPELTFNHQGNQIAFTKTEPDLENGEEHDQVVIFDIASHQLKQVSSFSGYFEGAWMEINGIWFTWDDQKLLLDCGRRSDFRRLHLLDLNTGNVAIVASLANGGMVSPDGKWLVFDHGHFSEGNYQSGPFLLWVKALTTNLAGLPKTPDEETADQFSFQKIFGHKYSFSPGERILFTAPGPGSYYVAGFSPDSSRVLVGFWSGKSSEIWTVNIDGSNPVKLADNASQPIWMP